MGGGAVDNSEGDGYLELDVNTFGRNLELATLGNGDGLDWLVSVRCLVVLDLVDKLVALEDLAEDHMTTVEPTAMIC